ncbi:MAG TPA: DUF1890 domain-containing protein [Methanomicrobiales archaeon]|nr:DUF1890 domain-containing protein [Methanomicrobiales archaeon]
MVENTDTGKSALLLLGCPEVPVQTTLALYLADRLRKKGISAVVAGTNSPRTLLTMADPDKHYISSTVDLDRFIDDLAEKRVDYPLCFVFIHNDAGISYAATIAALSQARLFLIIFGKEAESLAKEVNFKAEILAAKAVHNPLPLKRKIDEVT